MDIKNKIVVCSGKIRPVAVAYLQNKVNLKSWQQRGPVPQEQWERWLAEADAVYSSGNIRIDKALLRKAPKVQVIAQASVGYDNFDVAACRAHQVKIGNTPGVLVNAVADLAYGLLLDTARNIVQGASPCGGRSLGPEKSAGYGCGSVWKNTGYSGVG